MLPVATSPETLSLEIPRAIALSITPEQFEALSVVNRDLKLERTAQGELIVNPPTGGESGQRNFQITGQLFRWCEENEALGVGFDSSTGFRLPNGAIRSPDVSWLSRERWDSLTPKEKKGLIPLCPDFVVELRSDSDSLDKLQEKLLEYRENGARLGWLIDPYNCRVEIYRQGKEVEILNNPSDLSGEDVLPNFGLSLRL